MRTNLDGLTTDEVFDLEKYFDKELRRLMLGSMCGDVFSTACCLSEVRLNLLDRSKNEEQEEEEELK